MGNDISKSSSSSGDMRLHHSNSEPTRLSARMADGCMPNDKVRQVDHELVKKFKSQISKNEVEYAKMTSQLKSFDPVVDVL